MFLTHLSVFSEWLQINLIEYIDQKTFEDEEVDLKIIARAMLFQKKILGHSKDAEMSYLHFPLNELISVST